MVGFSAREHSIRADVKLLKEARDFAERAAAEFGFDAQARAEVKLALSEAVTNAIRHGSESADDPIEIVVSEEERRLDFSVADTGMFIHRFKLRRDLAERGRGLAFIAELMDGLEVRPDYEGTTICFSKRRS